MKRVTIFVGCLLLLVAGIWLFLFVIKETPNQVVAKHLKAIRAGDTDAAYQFFSQSYREQTTYDEFRFLVKRYSFLPEHTASFFEKIQEDPAQVSLEGKINTRNQIQIPAVYVLVKAGGRWQIEHFEFFIDQNLYPELAVPVSAPVSALDNDLIALPKKFYEASMGYSISYPANWMYYASDGPNNIKLVRENDVENENAVVHIGYEKADDLLAYVEGFQNDLASRHTGYSLLDSEEYSYWMRGGVELHGRQFLVEYQVGNTAYRAWHIVLPRRGLNRVYNWSFSAPVDTYNLNLDIAQAILLSWQIRE